MPSWILLHTHSVMAFIMAATQVAMLIFLLTSKEDIPVRKWITLNYLASSIWYIDQIFRFSLFPGTEGSVLYKLETILIYSPSLALLMLSNFQIFYLFIESPFEKERKTILKATIPAALILITALAWNELQNNSNIIYFQAISFVWGLLTNVGIFIIAFRKMIAFKSINTDGFNAHFLFIVAALSFLFLSIINLIFGLYSAIGYWTFFIFIWIGNLTLIVTYLTYSNVFVSFQIKITGYSFVAVVTFVAVIALVYFPPIDPKNIPVRLKQQQGLETLFIILSGAIVLIVLLLPNLLRRTLTNPLKRLLFAVKEVNSGDLAIEVPVVYKDEIGLLTHNFNIMTQNLRIAKEQLIEYNVTLSELYSNQQKIQENTLNHVSQEIHDNVGQLLSLVSVQLNLAAEKQGSESQILIDARENIKRAMRDLRDLAKGMSSDRIKLLGLYASVEQEVERIRQSGICEVQINCEGESLKMDYQREIILFRVLQECLQNVLKHSEAKILDIKFTYTSNVLSIEIKDDGKGFLIQPANGSYGLGLMNMRNRIQLMRGQISVESAPRAGTSISIQLPIE